MLHANTCKIIFLQGDILKDVEGTYSLKLFGLISTLFIIVKMLLY